MFLKVFIYLLQRDRVTTSRGETDRGGPRIRSRLWAVGTEPDVGLKPTNHEIVT